jgi:hypothetical protein
MNSIELTLQKWYDAKTQIDELEKKIKSYKLVISKELNSKGIDKFKTGDITVSRRRTTRFHLSKENVPSHIWNEYAVRCSYDVFHLKKVR